MEDIAMRRIWIGAMTAAALVVASGANAQPSERVVTGAAIGAGTGAIVAGPPGAVVGGVVGAVVGGPRISKPARYCWRDRHGHRHCRWR
jgi:hypothetical protein